MRLIKAAAAVLNQTPLGWDGNKANIFSAIEVARAQGASLLCLPELCITGYGCEDAFGSRGMQEAALEILAEILPATHGLIVTLGLPLLVGKALYNAAALVVDGRLLGFACKQHLAGEGLHYEPRWFKRWPEGRRAQVRIGGQDYPVGDLIFEVGGVRLGFEICEDAWVADRPGCRLARKGVDVILNPSASHFAFGKYEVRQRFVNGTNISKMFARLHPSCAANAIWICNQMLIPQLLSIHLQGTNSDFPLVTQSGGKFYMLTREIIFTEKVPAAGSQGDITLTDLSQYHIGMRKEMSLEKSNAPGWSTDETYFRNIMRVDGVGAWSKAVTPKNGDTLSWAVTLGARE